MSSLSITIECKSVWLFWLDFKDMNWISKGRKICAVNYIFLKPIFTVYTKIVVNKEEVDHYISQKELLFNWALSLIVDLKVNVSWWIHIFFQANFDDLHKKCREQGKSWSLYFTEATLIQLSIESNSWSENKFKLMNPHFFSSQFWGATQKMLWTRKKLIIIFHRSNCYSTEHWVQ